MSQSGAAQQPFTVDQFSREELIELVERLTWERDELVERLEAGLASLCDDAVLHLLFSPDARRPSDEKRRELERVARLLVRHVRPARRARGVFVCWASRWAEINVVQAREVFDLAARAEVERLRR